MKILMQNTNFRKFHNLLLVPRELRALKNGKEVSECVAGNLLGLCRTKHSLPARTPTTDSFLFTMQNCMRPFLLLIPLVIMNLLYFALSPRIKILASEYSGNQDNLHNCPLSPDPNSENLKNSLNFDESLTFVKISPPLDPKAAFFVYKHDKMLKWVTKEKSEIAVMEVFVENLSKSPCEEDEIVLDIGANTGFFGLYSATKGCKTLLFDPQPTCGQWIRGAILLNGFNDLATLVPNPVGINQGTMGVSKSTSCGGRFPQIEFEKGNMNLTFEDEVEVEFVSIDEILNNNSTLIRNVRVAKVDTEGAEFYVLESMLSLLRNRVVENLIVETTPKFWTKMGIERKQVADLYRQIWNFGYSCRALHPPEKFSSVDSLHEWALTGSFVQIDVLFERT